MQKPKGKNEEKQPKIMGASSRFPALRKQNWLQLVSNIRLGTGRSVFKS